MQINVEILSKEGWNSELLFRWMELFNGCDIEEPFFLSPGFSEYIDKFQNQNDLLRVVVVKDFSGTIIGLVPIRVHSYQLGISVGGRTIGFPQSWLTAATILGSTLMINGGDDLKKSALEKILELFTQCDLLIFPSALESNLPANYSVSNYRVSGFRYTVLNGWRECHKIILPSTYELYLSKFGRKKRYNINRQIRLLDEISEGGVRLLRVSSADSVNQLRDAADLLGRQGRGLSIEKMKYLADKGILRGYLLVSSGEVCAAVIGFFAKGVLCVPEILVNPKFMSFSPGASMVHLMVKDLIESDGQSIDMGFGSPSYNHSSINTVAHRGTLVFYRIKVKTLFLFSVRFLLSKTLGYARALVDDRRGRRD